ncbi:MAG: Hpt domain-containing protein [Gammaproteobacteria bacterium]|nr:Hpt domain-containing protein [Gammaproteobacteria bacterium]
MSTHSKVDLSTLGWVKTEIDETLKQARLALESFAENPTDKTRLRFCITHLHQVVGTLLMVELDGAAMLAKETEALAEDVINDKVEPDSRTLDALTRGILTLPDYLARLQSGQADVPLRHIGLMNEMRSVRKTTPISELELFSPDLSVRPPPSESPAKKLAEDEYRELAKQMRGGFQPALLDWLRDVTNKTPLQKIADIFEQLQITAGLTVLEQLFWVTGGFLEAIKDDGLEVTAERKKLFARLDQHIKKIIDGADKSTLRTSSESLTRALLWEIAQAKSRGPRIVPLKRAFDLEFLLSGNTTDTTPGKDELPTPEALASVSSALSKEIEAAQDLMSSYFDPESHGTASLEPLLESFHKMSGTLDMLNVPLLKSLVDELSLTCRAVIDNKLMNPEKISMPMAEALLMVESSTRDISRSPTEWKNQVEEAIQHLHRLHSPEGAETLPASDGLEVSDAELTESDYIQLLGVVASEVSINLGRIEEALESFASDTTRLESLDEVPQLLSQILGAMQILGQTRAADLVEVTKGHVDNICRGLLVADSAIMDGLAVSVGTIGAYIEGLRAERQNLDVLIDSAFQEMEAALASGHGRQRDPALLIDGIRLSLESWMDDFENEPARETLMHQLEELIHLAQEQEQEKISRISSEMSHLLALVAEDPSRVSDEIIETLKQSFTAMSVLAGRRMTLRTTPPPPPETVDESETEEESAPPVVSREQKKAPAPKPPAPHAHPAADAEFDAEIMEIFVEDARDVLENIRNKFIVWREDTDNLNALTELRRGYHTLKGSGRMVGASEVAELAWDVETVLNRIREGKIVPSTAIVDLLQQTQDALPHLIDVLAGGAEHNFDVDGLREIARGLAHADSTQAATSRMPEMPTPKPVAKPVPTDELGDLPKLERALLEIFTTEALDNLENIRRQIQNCRESGSACFVSEPFFRSVHTLQGNARSLGLQVMSQACAEIEKLLHALKSANLPLNETYLRLASRFESAVTRLVELMNSSATSSGSLRQEFADLARDLHTETQHIAKTEHEHHVAPETLAAPAMEIEEDVAPEPEIDETLSAPPPTKLSRPTATQAPPPIAAEPPEPEQLDPELLEIFQEEASDILTSLEETLTRWRNRPEDHRGHVAELKRSLHTLKGGARMAGAMAMGNLSHNTETLLKNIEDNKVQVDNHVFDLLHEAQDMLVVMLESARESRPIPDTSELNANLLALSVSEDLPDDKSIAKNAPEVPTSEPAEQFIAEPELEPEAVTHEAETASTAAPRAAKEIIEERRDLPEIVEKTWPDKMERRGQVRVNTSLLNDLVNYAGEVSISRSRMEQQIFSFRDNMGELSRNIVRFREQIRELEIQSESQILYRLEQEAGIEGRTGDFDPLEFDRFSRLQQLSRSLAESLHDLGTIQNNLGNFVGEAETVLQQQARINTELQEGLMRTRMVSFSTQAARLRHIIRQTSRELGKRVELHLENAEVELDRNVLERMIGPFEHMIRNSIDHGIESESERHRKGKPAVGRINIVSSQEGAEVIIRFSDDGAGLNIAGIREKAIERGLMSPDAVLTEEELIQFILMSGFSTSDKITHLSGRGVGMDVVHSEVKQLGGSMSVDTEPGVGTTFIIRLPLTLSIAQSLMVYVGDQLFALPLGSVVNIIEFPIEKIASISMGKNPLLTHDETVYPYMHLGQRLGITSQPRNGKKVPVLLARTGTREVAIQVDGLGGTREVVIKSLGPQLSELKGLAGATILGDGRVILILDIPGLWFREDVMHFEHRPEGKIAQEVRARPVVMVVDDSLTVRKVTSKHLQKRGMDVLVAKDGLDAVEQLRDHLPDVMLVDIEMPRMDGYELTTRVRSDENLKHIPIIIITSRAGAKHRQKAFELGVDIYMSKPYQEEDLFKNIDTLIAQGRTK